LTISKFRDIKRKLLNNWLDLVGGKMNKRIAYVGLSTPVFYDYKYSARETNADTRSSPNPILDSPYGLLLLYDEIWFLTRSLCPDNMRDLPYVNFRTRWDFCQI
jgi:hypothetical protein